MGTRGMLKTVVQALRRAVDVYHSPGQDPKKFAVAEKPTFAMPLWAFDQVIVTPEVDAPPHLADPYFPELGVLRTTNRRDYIDMINDLNMEPGPTYTFGFWGVAQFTDCVNWEICNVLPMRIDLNNFCGKP